MSEYLTTTQAAEFCGVTRFTIRNWVNSSGLKAYKTAGGHRRILKRDLISFMKEERIAKIHEKGVKEEIAPRAKSQESRLKNTSYRIPRCWEFHFKTPGKHNCLNCLVFKEGANKCFLILRSFGPEKLQCQHGCLDCEYLKRYYPVKKNVMETVEKGAANRLQDMDHKREDDVPVFFRKGLYTSGKYVASITKVISRKKK